jgi:hypothetical protein
MASAATVAVAVAVGQGRAPHVRPLRRGIARLRPAQPALPHVLAVKLRRHGRTGAGGGKGHPLQLHRLVRALPAPRWCATPPAAPPPPPPPRIQTTASRKEGGEMGEIGVGPCPRTPIRVVGSAGVHLAHAVGGGQHRDLRCEPREGWRAAVTAAASQRSKRRWGSGGGAGRGDLRVWRRPAQLQRALRLRDAPRARGCLVRRGRTPAAAQSVRGEVPRRAQPRPLRLNISGREQAPHR